MTTGIRYVLLVVTVALIVIAFSVAINSKGLGF